MNRKMLYAVFAFLLVIALTSTACCGISNIVENAVSSLGDEDEFVDGLEVPSTKPTASEAEDQPQEEEQPQAEPTEAAGDTSDSPTSPIAPAGTPGRTMYVNGNQIEDMAVDGDTLWVATLGGVVAWDLNTGESVHYTTLDGLSSNGIFAVEVCPSVVVGTDEGIDIYDPDTGRWSPRPELLEEDPPDPDGDSNDYFRTVDEVMALHCDAENDRLFMDYWSIRILDLNSGEVTELTEDDGLPHNGFSQIAINGDEVWIATGWGGIARVTNGTDITVFDEESGDLPNDYVDYITVDQEGGIWGASSDGLHHYSNGTWTHYTDEDVEGFGFYVYDMDTAPDGSIWIAFSGEVCRFDPATVTCTEVIEFGDDPGQADDWLSSILIDPNGRFFYGTDNSGVSMFDDSGWTLFALEDQPMADNVITSSLQNSQGDIWFGTSNGGATRFSADGVSQETFTYLNSDINSSYIADMAEDPNGGIWFLHSYSVSHYAGGVWTIYEEEDGVREEGGDVIAVDGAGQLWIAGNEGLSIFDGTSFTNIGVDDGLPEGINFYALLPDGDTMWAGSSDGLFSFSGADFTHVLTEDTPDLEDEYIQALAMAADGSLLMAHSWDMLFYDPASGTITPIEDAPSWVNDIAVMPDGTFWVASSGLHHYDGGAWEVLTPFQGMPHFDIRTVLIDNQGALWAGGGSSGQGGGLIRIGDMGQAGSSLAPPADAPAAAAPAPSGNTTRQWASSATASSQYGSVNWAAEQATGEPNTEGCGDYGTAWASASAGGVDWLQVGFDTPVTPTEINIVQTYNPSQVSQVELVDTSGNTHVIFTDVPQEVDCPSALNILVDGADYEIDQIIITVDQSILGAWNEIDAVELIGY